MKKEAFNDQTEDYIYHVADIHTITPKNIKQSIPQSYHYHNCFEIIIIRKGGIKIIANYLLKELKEGDVVMLGNNLPHEIIGYSDDYKLYVIHIPQFILLWGMEQIPELCSELQFVKDSRNGYLFSSSKLCHKSVAIAKKIETNEGFMRISYLFRLLHLLSQSEPKEHLVNNWANETNTIQTHTGENSIDRTFRYLYQHYTEEHTLEEIAGYANQNKTALCRAFKKVSGYTIFQFINRLRIEKACKLIKSTDLNITNIAYQVGYNTFSHFNLQFQAVMQMSPSQYRKKGY